MLCGFENQTGNCEVRTVCGLALSRRGEAMRQHGMNRSSGDAEGTLVKTTQRWDMK